MLDQLYIPIKSDISTGPSIEEKVSDYFSGNILDEGEIGTHTNIACVIHGPFSMFDLKGVLDPESVPERTRSDLSSEINLLASALPQGKRFLEAYNSSRNSTPCDLFGYQPFGLGLTANEEVNAVDFLSLFLMKISIELNRLGHTGSRYVVLHPDALFFPGGNDEVGLQQMVRVYDEFAKILGLMIVYENVVFKNPKYFNNVPWAMDPTFLIRIVGESKSSGVCLDLSHLLQTFEMSSRKSSDAGKLSYHIVQSCGRNASPLVLHARQGNEKSGGIDSTHSVFGETIRLAYKNAIPVVYEPDSRA